MKRKNLIIACLMIIGGSVVIVDQSIAQTPTTFVAPDPIPPTPDAAKLAQFGLVPTNLYTGTHSFSVPIYSIQFDGISIPLTLAYHAGGIRASENSSWVGLGWALSTGGSISRNVQGLNDFQNSNGFVGYVYDATAVPDQLLSPVLDSNGETINWQDPYWVTYLRGMVDTEPDIFTYNFLGASGSFILSKKSETANVIQVIKLKENADKVVYDESTNSFTVYTPDGFKGIFSVKEYVTNISGSNTNGDWSACSGQYVDLLQTLNQGGRAVTSWYLSSIVSPNGKTLTYNYALNANGFSDYISISSRTWGEIKTVDTPVVGAGSGGEDYMNQKCSRVVNEHVYLSSITSADAGLSITFSKTDRIDVERLDRSTTAYSSWLDMIGGRRNETITTPYKPQRLTNIAITNTLANSTLNLQINFGQSYFNPLYEGTTNSFEYLRLKLDSVSVGPQEYSFQYNDGLPDKSTLGVDYWGYYNGRNTNTTISPVLVTYPPDAILTVWHLPGNYYYQTDNRKANFNYGKAGLLTRVTYPTGGYTEFDYESHEYKLVGKEQLPPPSDVAYSVSGLSSDETETFTLKDKYQDGCFGTIRLTLSTKCKDFYLGNNCTIASEDVNTTAAVLTDGNGVELFALKYDYQWGQGLNNYTKTYSFNVGYDNTLGGGTYMIKSHGKRQNGQTIYYGDVNITIPYSCDASSSAPAIIDVVRNQAAGGARIKSIRMYNHDGTPALKRSYQYASPDQGGQFSSGKLMNPLMNMAHHSNGLGNNYWIYTSGSSISNGNAAQGNHVGYTYVREIVEDFGGNNNGLLDHYFYNEANVVQAWGQNNQVAIANSSFESINGSSDYESVFSSTTPPNTAAVVKSTDYINQFAVSGYVNALRVNWFRNGDVLKPDLHSFYKIPKGAVQTTQITTQDYSQGTTPTIQKFIYNARNQVVTTTTEDNTGVFLREEMKYPVDYPTPSATIQAMIDRNIVGAPIESKTIIRGVDASAGAQKVKLENNRILPERMFSHNRDQGAHSFSSDGTTLAASYDEKAILTHNTSGDLVQVVTSDGITTSYIWGYNKNYVVAKIVGTSRAEIESLLGSTVDNGVAGLSTASINQLKLSFPGALITTYTYNPGIGVSSATDPNGIVMTYIYDEIGRLTMIKDNNGNVLKTFHYNYMEH